VLQGPSNPLDWYNFAAHETSSALPSGGASQDHLSEGLLPPDFVGTGQNARRLSFRRENSSNVRAAVEAFIGEFQTKLQFNSNPIATVGL
jgi:hypothetical protein